MNSPRELRQNQHGNAFLLRFLVSVACGIVLFILMQSSPSILDVTLPRNESRPRYLLLPMEYIADHEKYFCLILLHISVLISVAGIIVLATGLVLIACQEFICGMFTVTR